jgi:hypothetical protein
LAVVAAVFVVEVGGGGAAGCWLNAASRIMDVTLI